MAQAVLVERHTREAAIELYQTGTSIVPAYPKDLVQC